MKTLASFALVLAAAGALSACTTNEEYEARIAEAEARAQHAEAMAEAAMRAAQENEEKANRMFDATQRK